MCAKVKVGDNVIYVGRRINDVYCGVVQKINTDDSADILLNECGDFITKEERTKTSVVHSSDGNLFTWHTIAEDPYGRNPCERA